jgi:ectoine hydroxylase-related dioxygenase (phytanoyl-CoA dioxygenase family)
MNASTQRILAHGFELHAANGSFGELRRSDDVSADFESLRSRFADDGYLYLPGFFEREEIAHIRRHVAEILASKGLLDDSHPIGDLVKKEGADMGFMANPWLAMEFMNSIAKNIPAMQRLLYSGRIMEFFRGFFGAESRHFDFTWVRTMSKGFGTDPHCDIVYMGRGSSQVCTLWTPFSDISYEIGGLMILEGSNKKSEVLRNYLSRDVDTYCGNRPEAGKIESGEIPWTWGGVLSKNPATLNHRLGGRWLSAEYRQGDILIFGMKTVHASLDNQTRSFRISTDSRYQPASEPIDDRWIGENPVGHGRGAKRAMIC